MIGRITDDLNKALKSCYVFVGRRVLSVMWDARQFLSGCARRESISFSSS